MADFIRPNSDVVQVNVTGGYTAIDETVADDGDYVVTTGGASGAGSQLTVGLSTISDPGDIAHTVRVRFQVLNEGNDNPLVVVRLDEDGGSQITAFNDVYAPTGQFDTFEYELSGAELSSLDDYGNLQLRFSVSNSGSPYNNVRISWAEVEVPDAVPPASWWQGSEPFTDWYQESETEPDEIELEFPVWEDDTYYPTGTTIGWTETDAPDDEGWWFSIGENFAGSAVLIADSRPKNPRGFEEVDDFATGSAFPYSSFPGVVGTFKNKLIYTPGGYVVGTDKPTLRVFDGTFDREICKIPVTSAGAVPKAIISILVANGTIYLSTFDSGTTSSNFAGRVFELNFETGVLTPIGSATTFSGGHLPYALAWHNGRLWCGTTTTDPDTEGRIYFYRPLQDTDWTLEHTLSVGCVSSMVSYKGLLYIGCTAPASTFAKVMVRQADNTYATSLTATGGTAAANNGFPSMVEFEGDLYAGYWNDDSTEVAKIYTFDNSSWTTAYTGSGDTIVPYVALATDGDFIYAIGGGSGRDAVLLTSTDGSSWNDRTVFLHQSSPASTGLPAYGMVSL